MIEALTSVLSAILSLLPSSPIVALLVMVDKIEILGMVNYFIPFDTCALMMNIWLGCVAIYYVVTHVDKILSKIPFL